VWSHPAVTNILSLSALGPPAKVALNPWHPSSAHAACMREPSESGQAAQRQESPRPWPSSACTPTSSFPGASPQCLGCYPRATPVVVRTYPGTERRAHLQRDNHFHPRSTSVRANQCLPWLPPTVIARRTTLSPLDKQQVPKKSPMCFPLWLDSRPIQCAGQQCLLVDPLCLLHLKSTQSWLPQWSPAFLPNGQPQHDFTEYHVRAWPFKPPRLIPLPESIFSTRVHCDGISLVLLVFMIL
jgi:hypothetical protein